MFILPKGTAAALVGKHLDERKLRSGFILKVRKFEGLSFKLGSASMATCSWNVYKSTAFNCKRLRPLSLSTSAFSATFPRVLGGMGVTMGVFGPWLRKLMGYI